MQMPEYLPKYAGVACVCRGVRGVLCSQCDDCDCVHTAAAAYKIDICCVHELLQLFAFHHIHHQQHYTQSVQNAIHIMRTV